jgi:hypothetical protein
MLAWNQRFVTGLLPLLELVPLSFFVLRQEGNAADIKMLLL